MSQDTNHPVQRKILSVSQLNRLTKNLLENNLPLIWIEGELSNLARPASGHWYFTLKDQQAQVKCAMFKGRNTTVRFRPQSGDQVLLRCRVSLYEGRGEFQLIAEHMQEAGLGALQRRFEELKKQLSAEGLFDVGSKQPLPATPEQIGVITSPSGAAVHDIISVLKRRFPMTKVTVYPTSVQGDKAAGEIVGAIQQANSHRQCDVLIVGRGGGSLEDMWPFNEEIVARAIFNSHIPVVSAVGHEVDVTIADFVADLRAPTPSAAAELLSPDGDELLSTFADMENLLKQRIKQQLDGRQQTLIHLQKRLRHPGDKLREQAQRLDHIESRLAGILSDKIHKQQSRLNILAGRLGRFHPEIKIDQIRLQLANTNQRLLQSILQKLNHKQQALAKLAGVMQAVSPLQTINRGYAALQNDSGDVIRSAEQITAGETIKATLADSQLHCSVEHITLIKDPLKVILDR